MKLGNVIIFCLWCCSIYGQTITFNKRVAFGCTNTVLTSLEATDSCYYATGFARNSVGCGKSALFVKFDLFGNTLFNKILPTDTSTYETWESSLRTDTDNNLVVSYYQYDTAAAMGGGVLKYDSNGDMIWNSLHYNPHTVGRYFNPRDLQITNDSGYILVNSIANPISATDLSILKLDKYGNEDWHVTRGVLNYVESWGCSYVANNGTYIIGYQQDNLSAVQINYTVRSKLEKIDSVGGTIWTYQSPSNQQVYGVNDLIKSKDGGWVVASALGYEKLGASGTWSSFLYDSYVYKLDSVRNLVWDKVFYSGTDDKASFKKIIELEDSSLVAFGTILRLYPPYNPTYYIIHGRVVKLSPQGDSLWSREYEYLHQQDSWHTIYDAERTYDGGFLVCGGADYTSSGPYQQGWLLKLNEHGCLVPGCHLALNTEPTAAVENMRMLLYPNPTVDYLNVFYQTGKVGNELTFSVYDVQGKLLQNYTTADVSDKTYIVPVYELVAGIYVLEVRQDGQLLKSEKFVKN